MGAASMATSGWLKALLGKCNDEIETRSALILLQVLIGIGCLVLNIIILGKQNKDNSPGDLAANETTTLAPMASTIAPTVSNSPGFQEAAKYLISGIDTSVDPCVDFYAFTCGKWLNEHPLNDGEGRIGTYDVSQQIVDDTIAKQLDIINNSLSNFSQTEQMAAKFFTACISEEGSQPRVSEINGVMQDLFQGFPMLTNGWSTISGSQFWRSVGQLELQYALPTLLESFVTVDWGNISRNALYINQGPLFLPRAYYVKPQFIPQLNDYLDSVKQAIKAFRTAINSNSNDIDIDQACERAVNFEVQLALAMSPDDLLRNYQQQFNELSLDGLGMVFRTIDWAAYLNGSLSQVNPSYIKDRFVVQEPTYIGVLNTLSRDPSLLQIMIDFVCIRILQDNDDFLTASFHKRLPESIRATKPWRPSMHPRPWIRFSDVDDDARRGCVELLSAYMPYSTGYIYVNSIADREAARKDVTDQTNRIIQEFIGMVGTLTWMSTNSKSAAAEKAKNLVINIGWPDWMMNTTQLDIYHQLYLPIINFGNAQLWEMINVLKMASQMTENFGLLEKNPDRTNFLLSPSIVNAWYQPERNSITFPYAAFNPPYYRVDFPQAYNFAGQGGTAGHELTHGFDDEDCLWNRCGWMDMNSSAGFSNMAMCVVNQFSQKCCPLKQGNVRCTNGEQTQGENIADLGGQLAAYNAYRSYVKDVLNGVEEPRLPGLEQYTPSQIFWITYGFSWCMQQSYDSLVRQLLINPHAPGSCRTNQVLQDIPAFAADFRCPQGSAMYPFAEDRCKVWTDN